MLREVVNVSLAVHRATRADGESRAAVKRRGLTYEIHVLAQDLAPARLTRSRYAELRKRHRPSSLPSTVLTTEARRLASRPQYDGITEACATSSGKARGSSEAPCQSLRYLGASGG